MTSARQYAVDFLNRATNGAKGVGRGSAPYERVTEGRHVLANYSGCGDLANALLYALGMRDSRYVNRKENGAYRIGFNVAVLDSLARQLRDYAKQPLTRADVAALQPGDITIVWNRVDTSDAHVAVVRAAPDEALAELLTADYGQGAPLDGKQCAREVRRTVNGDPLLGSRRLQRIISLDAAMGLTTGAERIPLDDYFKTVPKLPTLRKGSKGAHVETLQLALNARKPLLKLSIDGVFGPVTEAAVRDFQSSYSLVADGIVGPATWGALEG